jgi:hypothetical protein
LAADAENKLAKIALIKSTLLRWGPVGSFSRGLLTVVVPAVAARFGFGELWLELGEAVSSTTPGC